MLEIEKLDFSYQKKKILKKINFKAKKGEFISLLGANGSGKTTFLHCIQGLLPLKEGKILIDGENIIQLSKKEIAQKISVVPQENKNVFAYEVLEMVVMGVNPWLAFTEHPSPEDYQKAEKILEDLGVVDLKGKNFNQISGGERQLVLIARALMQQTDILLLDEPNSHLDFKNVHLMMEIMRDLSFKNKTVITALHDPNLAYKYSDRVIILKEGEILASGVVEEVMTAANLSAAYDLKIQKVKPNFSLEFRPAHKFKKKA
ncbi:ABC transporter ATP-binding protein [Halanaerobium sp. Z-7514]|uniref:ABC transporter ATP-binding protein n=1 Tax=Halanaerobium polyolivorans TaxID=2886943 RepID=A0AAW4X141_9FIRM|nr:ABC transporter ATP-binding protein [Halanaerobium polyolivorans]MCC3145517.1 ABC transporter ATP-binding protein [Halanaerobium polyolivorans]RQD69542.1 MAG: ABC transporter ATP-binding protein [Halanaerobium sp. MSAO_Bac5]